MSNCLICQKPMNRFGQKDGCVIFKCISCGLGETQDLKPKGGKYHRDQTYIEEESLFENIFLKRVNKIVKFLEKGRVLEIGCSTGIMLSLLQKRGFVVQGVEVSKNAIDVARKKGIDVLIGDFNKLKINEKFDVVILNHTLEHLDNPLEVVEKINSLLSPGGLLYIDVPNFGGLSARLWGENWPLLLPHEHKWHFTFSSLKILLSSIGFKIIFVDRSSGIWDYESPLEGVLISLLSLKKRFLGEVLTALPSWVVSKLGMGSDLMVIARKE